MALEAIKIYYTGVSEDMLLKEPQMKSLRDKLLGTAVDFYKKPQQSLQGKPGPKAQTDRPNSRGTRTKGWTGSVAPLPQKLPACWKGGGGQTQITTPCITAPSSRSCCSTWPSRPSRSPWL
jgi:hypothetical protein